MQNRPNLRLLGLGAVAALAIFSPSCSSTSQVHVSWFRPMLPSAATGNAEQSTELAASSDLDSDVWRRVGEPQKGHASWYGVACNGGTHTASMEPLRDSALTAAHKTLPMGTMVQVRNESNGKTVILRITDRGPYIKGRIIDVTPAAADALGMRRAGVANCTVQVIEAVEKLSSQS